MMISNYAYEVCNDYFDIDVLHMTFVMKVTMIILIFEMKSEIIHKTFAMKITIIFFILT